MKRLVVLTVVACSSREATPTVTSAESRRDGNDATTLHDPSSKQSSIDRTKLILPEWKPPDDVVHFTYPVAAAGGYGTLDYYIDRTEVTVQAYRECVKAGVCLEPGPDAILEIYRDWAKARPDHEVPSEDRCPHDQFNWAHHDRGDHPVNCVTFWQAWQYCKFRGKRLPIEYEWEAAAGREGLSERPEYPWGDAPLSCDRAVVAASGPKKQRGCATGRTMPVGSKPRGATPSGIVDLIGNVEEIVLSSADGPADDRKSLTKGGSYADDRLLRGIESSSRAHNGVTVGFRCLIPPRNRRDHTKPMRIHAPPPSSAR